MDIKNKNKISKRKSALYIYTKFANGFNNVLKPLDKSVLGIKKAVVQSKEYIPMVYSYFEGLGRKYFVSPKNFTKDPNFQNIGYIIATHVARFFPHVDDVHIGQVFSNDKTPFLKAISEGFGVFRKKDKEYSILHKKHIFRRVLVANRGEIALRIIRACKELGIEVVALYSKDEKDSLAVKFASKSYNIGASKNYLNIKKIVNIAKKAGADAIHPGYGFLSENAKFAKLCEKKRIKFIGPTSRMISLLGNKVTAKKSMQKSGIPIIQGTASAKSIEAALKVANSLGYPVIIKSSSGGGGKGMRIIRKPEEIASAYESAKAEAMNSFGNDSVYIEKYIEEPRHIEFQILADKHGNVIHLGERDCTIQRKHQKLIEEAPSPALSPALREKIGEAAVNAVKTIKYEGAGTTEFLFDRDGSYYFIEMNTRIQVEHGVTEIITGVDLIKEQIKLAGGARLALKQENVKIEGHAIECRINAEDPLEGFIPSTGTVLNYLPPGGPGIRISSSCHAGYKIEPEFDSLISLIICHGKTRQESIARMLRALEEYVIEGVSTTIPFHKFMLQHPEFVKGNISTPFIEKYNIIENLKKENRNGKHKKNSLSEEKKVLVVTTAVSQYMVKKKQCLQYNNGKSNWVNAARQEALSEGSVEE